MAPVSPQTFQSTLSSRRATTEWTQSSHRQPDFNPRSPHGERPTRSAMPLTTDYFNPRSPHGERLDTSVAIKSPPTYFNPRSPHGERPRPGYQPEPKLTFQSTLSSRRATLDQSSSGRVAAYFNPRSPHGERHVQDEESVVVHGISIHALLTESDRTRFELLEGKPEFQSTLSSRRATDSCPISMLG